MKKLLLSIFILGLSFLSFSNAGSYTYTGTVDLHGFSSPTYFFSLTVPYANGEDFYATDSNNRSHTTVNVDLTCTFSNISLSKSSFYVSMVGYYVNKISWSNVNLGTKNYLSSSTYTYNFTNRLGVIRVGWGESANLDSPYNIKFDYSCTFSGNDIIGSTSCTNYTSEECQIEYGLVTSGALSSCQSDLESCESFTNGFNQQLNNCNSSLNACNSSLTSCLQSNCPVTSGDVARSNIYVNDILFPGKPLVNILIPDYITWDYTGSDVSFDVYVGSGYDVDYINSIVDINSYRPGSEDFTNIFVGGLTLIFPYIFIALLILFIWKLVKRIFK